MSATATIVDIDGILRVHWKGHLMEQEVANLRSAIDAALATYADAPRLIFNLENATDIDSAVVAMLIAVNVAVHRVGGRLAVVGFASHLPHFLTDGRLLCTFEIYERHEAAVKEMAV